MENHQKGLILIIILLPGLPLYAADWDFSRHDIPIEDILSGGPPKDGIPSIDAPRFQSISAEADLAAREGRLPSHVWLVLAACVGAGYWRLSLTYAHVVAGVDPGRANGTKCSSTSAESRPFA